MDGRTGGRANRRNKRATTERAVDVVIDAAERGPNEQTIERCGTTVPEKIDAKIYLYRTTQHAYPLQFYHSVSLNLPFDVSW